jgi:hypothetical protein
MILLDNNQLIIANIFVAMKHSDIEDENTIRHLCVNAYRYYNQKFKAEFGDIIICHDSPHCWRKDSFKEYKANRKVSKAKSDHDWNKIFDIMTTIREEIEDNFQWKNISVPHAEADDIIASIVEDSIPIEPILIISSDKDFQQLQKYSNVKQWSPLKQNYIVCENPENYLLTHIIKGDSSDGVPNILSDDDTFIDKDKRQTPMTKKKMSSIVDDLSEWENTDNWKRNKKVIDFSEIPEEIKSNTINELNKPHERNTGKIYSYLVENKLASLLEVAEELY